LHLIRGKHPLDKTFKVWDSPIWFIVMAEAFYAHDLRLRGYILRLGKVGDVYQF
jgi:hypothetical protein